MRQSLPCFVGWHRLTFHKPSLSQSLKCLSIGFSLWDLATVSWGSVWFCLRQSYLPGLPETCSVIRQPWTTVTSGSSRFHYEKAQIGSNKVQFPTPKLIKFSFQTRVHCISACLLIMKTLLQSPGRKEKAKRWLKLEGGKGGDTARWLCAGTDTCCQTCWPEFNPL